jgi:hypothetical protein
MGVSRLHPVEPHQRRDQHEQIWPRPKESRAKTMSCCECRWAIAPTPTDFQPRDISLASGVPT